MPKRCLPPWFTLCLLALASPVSSHASTLESATQAFRNGDVNTARAALDAVLSNTPPDAEAYRIADHNLAVLKAGQGDIQGAIAKFEAIIATHPVAAAAFENVKALRAVQAAQSLSKALGEATEAASPALRWLAGGPLSRPPRQALVDPDATEITAFVTDYARALGDRNPADFLGLYSPAYAPPDGNSRSAWQLEVLGAFTDAAPYTPEAELVESRPVSETLTVVAFSLHDPRSDTQRLRNVLLQRDANKQWKILSDL